jgi:hypothetical protein
MVDYIGAVHASRPGGARFTMDRPVIDGANGFAMRWGSNRPTGEVTGMDIGYVRDGHIAEVWSVVGQRRV